MRYFLTGSRVYGGYTKHSDIDIVVDKPSAGRIEDTLWMIGIECRKKFNSEYPGFHFTFLGFDFNIVVIGEGEDLDMDAWEYATKKMCEIPAIECRTGRKDKFREYCNEYKLGMGADESSLDWT